MNDQLTAFLPWLPIDRAITVIVVLWGVFWRNRHVDTHIGHVTKLIEAASKIYSTQLALTESNLKLEIQRVESFLKLEERTPPVVGIARG